MGSGALVLNALGELMGTMIFALVVPPVVDIGAGDLQRPAGVGRGQGRHCPDRCDFNDRVRRSRVRTIPRAWWARAPLGA
jgi:hypothetical protein